jgi:hypothetical protein
MNAALLYRPRRRYLFWISLACAAVIHVGAVVFAKSKPNKTVVQDFRPPGVDVEVVDAKPEPSPPEESVTTPPPEQLAPDEETFPEENQTPTPIRPHRKTRVPSVLEGTRMMFGSVKALVTYAPRPIYPYEARRQRLIG